jgi:hypothetical protein
MLPIQSEEKLDAYLCPVFVVIGLVSVTSLAAPDGVIQLGRDHFILTI